MRSILLFLKKLAFPFVVIFILVILMIAIILQSRMTNDHSKEASIQPTNRKCAPTPKPADVILGTATATPNGINFNPVPPPAPSVTPLPLSKINDLAPDLPDNDKAYIYIMHCDGSFELYKVKAGENLTDALPLQPDDVIYDVVPPASIMGHQPPIYVAPTITPSSPSNPAYPPPGSLSPTSPGAYQSPESSPLVTKVVPTIISGITPLSPEQMATEIQRLKDMSDITLDSIGQTFTFTLNFSSFFIFLDDDKYPVRQLTFKCEPEPLLLCISNGFFRGPDHYPVYYEGTKIGKCTVENGDFYANIVFVEPTPSLKTRTPLPTYAPPNP